MENPSATAKIDAKIAKVKASLLALGPMRPGTLSQQYRKPQEKKGAFWQLSYTYLMKGRSEYVRPESLARIKRETATFKKFKLLEEKWIALELERSKLLTELEKPAKNS